MDKKHLPYEQYVSLYDHETVIDKISESVGNPSMIGIGNFKAMVDAEMNWVALVPPKIADDLVDLLNNLAKYKDD